MNMEGFGKREELSIIFSEIVMFNMWMQNNKKCQLKMTGYKKNMTE